MLHGGDDEVKYEDQDACRFKPERAGIDGLFKACEARASFYNV
jgi:hypothetical protein